jgi:5'(3')-deoxyribonucleotidase
MTERLEEALNEAWCSDQRLIAIDVDGVVVNLLYSWLRRYNQEFEDHLTPADVTSFNLRDVVKPAAHDRIYEYLQEPGLYDEAPVIPYARRVVARLCELGYRPIFCTSCVPGPGTTEKHNWLVRHGFLPNSTHLYGGFHPDYVMMNDKTLINAMVLIDDRGDTIDAFTEQGRFGILFKTPRWEARWYTLDRWACLLALLGKMKAEGYFTEEVS